MHFFYLFWCVLEMSGSMIYVPDSHIVQDEDELEAHARSSTMEYNKPDPDMVHASHVLITTTKVIVYFSSVFA